MLKENDSIKQIPKNNPDSEVYTLTNFIFLTGRCWKALLRHEIPHLQPEEQLDRSILQDSKHKEQIMNDAYPIPIDS